MGDMTYRRLGTSGLAVSVVGIGCNNFSRRIDQDAAKAVVNAALECGITLFDTADVYGDPAGGSEEYLGAALKANGARDDVIIATKFGSPMGGANGPDWDARASRRYIARAVEGSLRRLGTDYIDLYQLHQPDLHTPIAETLSALDDLVRAGKVRYIGSSNFRAWQVADAEWTSRTSNLTAFISAQNEYSLLERRVETGLVPACVEYGVGILPYFPLAMGLLTGKHRLDNIQPGSRLSNDRFADYLAQVPWGVIDKLRHYAEERSLSMLDVAIGGLAAMPAVGSVIAGASTPDQVKANAAAVAWTPTAEDLSELDAITHRGSQS
jgi:aryl-alcohol dehydrogenase-like predicted oxidoreductase